MIVSPCCAQGNHVRVLHSLQSHLFKRLGGEGVYVICDFDDFFVMIHGSGATFLICTIYQLFLL